MKVLNLLKRRFVGAAMLAALTIAPMFALAPSADAQPRRYGNSSTYRRNRTVVERYRPRYRTNRSSYTRRSYTRSYVAPRRYSQGRYITRYRNGRPYRAYIR